MLMKYIIPDVRYEMNEEEIKRIKAVEIAILDDFVRVCKQLNLTYFLCAGTLLGAVRHQGFIPWDDDIDVQMPRRDYEIFAKEAQKYLSNNYVLESCYSCDECYDNFMKIRDVTTTFVETTSRNFDIPHGVYLDIFAIDSLPDDKKEQKKYAYKIELFKSRVLAKNCKSQFLPKRSFKGKLFSLYAYIMSGFSSARKAVIKRDKFILSHQDASSKVVIVESKTNRHYDKEIFNGISDVVFEGKHYCAPKLCHEYLLVQYGPNYMQLPPEEKRHPHHYCCILDLDVPYTAKLKEYLRK